MKQYPARSGPHNANSDVLHLRSEANSMTVSNAEYGSTCPLPADPEQPGETLHNADPDDAIRTIYRNNPLPNVCCRTCAADQAMPGDSCQILARQADQLDHERIKDVVVQTRAKFITGRRVAIIGTGAAALVAAYDLVLKGHGVVLYEADKLPGGGLREMVRSGLLDDVSLENDIDVILSLGIDLRLNMPIGRSITLDKLQTNFDAVLDTTGLFDDTDAPEWIWRCQDITGPEDVGRAVQDGHQVATELHDALMARMWQRA